MLEAALDRLLDETLASLLIEARLLELFPIELTLDWFEELLPGISLDDVELFDGAEALDMPGLLDKLLLLDDELALDDSIVVSLLT